MLVLIAHDVMLLLIAHDVILMITRDVTNNIIFMYIDVYFQYYFAILASKKYILPNTTK